MCAVTVRFGSFISVSNWDKYVYQTNLYTYNMVLASMRSLSPIRCQAGRPRAWLATIWMEMHSHSQCCEIDHK